MVTTADSLLLVDTCVLMEASNRARRHHRAARSLLERHEGLVFPAQVAREFLVVATRPPDHNGLGLGLAEALESLAGFREHIRLLPEEKPLLPALLRLLAGVPAAGRRIHDANLVAAAVVHGVSRIVTLNGNDFRAFCDHDRRIRCIAPTEALSA
ncbi:MAG: type II toxin-antitoxin system VapC family toxin [Polyangia bacterium]|jgi:predicted nucleic acid-binding protein